MARWQLLAIASAIGWGVWGFASGSAASKGTAVGLLTGTVLVEVVLLLPFVGAVPRSFSWPLVGVAVSGLIAYGAFYAALTAGGSVSVVVTISALYPGVTVALAYLFRGERLSTAQLVGLVMAVISIILLTRD
jgi:transporter family protein